MADQDRADAAVLRLDDLPGEGWVQESEVVDESGGEPAAGQTLPDLDETGITASASSPCFKRRAAIAFSMAAVFDEDLRADEAFRVLGDDDFPEGLLAGVSADADSLRAGTTILGHHSEAVPEAGTAGGASHHRGRIVTGRSGGLDAIHVEVLVLRGGRTVAVAVLGDSPDPPGPDLTRHVSGQIGARLGL